jgi:magnesium transporter
MSTISENNKAQTRIEELNKALNSGTFIHARRMLNSIPPSEIAHLCESQPPATRNLLWTLIEEQMRANVLNDLSEETRNDILHTLDAEALADIIDDMQTDDLADILQQLPRTISKRLIDLMDEQARQRVERVLDYDDDTAGGLMNTDTLTVRPEITLDVVLRFLRRFKGLPQTTDSLWVVNRNDIFIGTLSLSKLLTSDVNMTVREAMDTDFQAINAELSDTEVANRFERQDLVSAPVVDSNNRLLGRITIDDVVDVIREGADHSMLSMAALDEDESTFAPIFRTSRRRSVWLGVYLITALLASLVIEQFSATISEIIALAVLMPIVSSMGGTAGNQTFAIVIRGLALGQIGRANARMLISRELRIGALNSILWAVSIGIITYIWFDDIRISYIISIAMAFNLIVAAFAGSTLPLILKRIGADPALAGSVLLIATTDVVGYFAFLGLASYFYM